MGLEDLPDIGELSWGLVQGNKCKSYEELDKNSFIEIAEVTYKVRYPSGTELLWELFYVYGKAVSKNPLTGNMENVIVVRDRLYDPIPSDDSGPRSIQLDDIVNYRTLK